MTADVRLQLLGPEHAAALEQFERGNREFFARHVGDRCDAYVERFEEQLAERIRENVEGTSLLFVVLDGDEVIGRVNITDIDRPEATELGFRVAEDVQGRGVATRAVAEALRVADARGVPTVAARVATTNPASQRVLERCGFVPTGPAEAPPGSPRRFVGYRWSPTSGP